MAVRRSPGSSTRSGAPRARRRLAPKTWERDAVIYRKHILPPLGERRIDVLDIEDLVEWQDALERARVGAPTMIKAIGILSSIFREAARRPRSTGVQGNPVIPSRSPVSRGPASAARLGPGGGRARPLAAGRQLASSWSSQGADGAARRAFGRPDGDDGMPAGGGAGVCAGET